MFPHERVKGFQIPQSRVSDEVLSDGNLSQKKGREREGSEWEERVGKRGGRERTGRREKGRGGWLAVHTDTVESLLQEEGLKDKALAPGLGR